MSMKSSKQGVDFMQMQVVSKQKGSIKILLDGKYFYLQTHPRGVEICILTFESPCKKMFQSLGVLPTHEDCVVYLKSVFNLCEAA